MQREGTAQRSQRTPKRRKNTRAPRSYRPIISLEPIRLSPTQVARVANAGKIPKEEWPRFEILLSLWLDIYLLLKNPLPNIVTRRMKIERLATAIKAARTLSDIMEDHWLHLDLAYYIDKRYLKGVQRSDAGVIEGQRRNRLASLSTSELIAAPSELVERLSALSEWYAKSPKTSEEKIAVTMGSKKSEVHVLLKHVTDYWTEGLGREAVITQSSLYVAFAQEVLRLAGADTGKWTTLRDRLRNYKEGYDMRFGTH